MLRSYFAAVAALAGLTLGACSRSDEAPRPQHSAVAAAMPDAAATPGAVGPATAAPHGAPPSVPTLSDTHPETQAAAAAANNASPPSSMAAAGSINQLDRATPPDQSSGKENAARSP